MIIVADNSLGMIDKFIHIALVVCENDKLLEMGRRRARVMPEALQRVIRPQCRKEAQGQRLVRRRFKRSVSQIIVNAFKIREFKIIADIGGMLLMDFKTGRINGKGDRNDFIAGANVVINLVSRVDMAELVFEVIFENLWMGDACPVPARAWNTHKTIGLNAIRLTFPEVEKKIGVINRVVISRCACLGEDGEGVIEVICGLLIESF